MATNIAIELDIADDEHPDTGPERWALEAAERHGVTAELIDPHGPGGGWPVWRFTGLEAALRALFEDYAGGPDLVALAGDSPADPDPFSTFVV